MKIFLENNKIFFDTIATVSFSIMTIILSIVSIYIAMQANKIAAKQVEVEKSEKMPFFTIGLVNEIIKGEYKYNNYQIVNIGGKINNAILTPTFRTQIFIGKKGHIYYFNMCTYNFEFHDLLENTEYFYDINQNGFNIEVRDDIMNKINNKLWEKVHANDVHFSALSIKVELLFDIKYVDFQGNNQCERYILSNNNLIRTKMFQRYAYSDYRGNRLDISVDEKIDYWINLILDQMIKKLGNYWESILF